MAEERTIPVATRIPRELVERLDRACERTGQVRNQFIQRAIRNELAQVEGLIKQSESPVGAMVLRLGVVMEKDAELRRRMQDFLDHVTATRGAAEEGEVSYG
jgi:metal-responsive CopG/Arc/MetJ family transcriptional regulator